MRKFSAGMLMILLSGCSFLQTGFEQPQPVLPETWSSVEDASKTSEAGEQWWTLFGDPALDALEEEALQFNHDLAVAAARILEAEAALGVTEADRYPIVTASGSGRRTGISEVTANPMFGGISRIQNNSRVTLDVSFEADVWGKYRRADDAARAQLLGTKAAQDTVRLTLASDVAEQYFNLVSVKAQMAVLNAQLKSRSESLELLRLRFREGLTSEYEVRQAEAEEASVRAQLAAINKTRETLESSLSVLLGRSPNDVMGANIESGSVPALQALWVPDGLPSDLLLRRPDIREAEQKLLAEDARIGVARAEFFPSISLTAFLGSESATLGRLFSGPAGIFQFALGLTQPLFNAHRLQFSVKAAEARREQAIAAYQKAVASAFGDVRNALAAQTSGRDQLNAQSARVEALVKAQKLANLRYEGGVSSRLEVLDADRQLLQAELAKVDAENAQKVAVLALFKALGGGWKAPEADEEPVATN